MRKPSLVVLLPVMFALHANAEGTAPVPKKLIEQRERLNQDVLRLSQPLKCAADTDCDSIGLGQKPCGGPWKFVLFSKKNSKVEKMKKKVAEYNDVDKQINEAQQMMSDCMAQVKPEPKCVNKMCVDGRGPAPGASATVPAAPVK